MHPRLRAILLFLLLVVLSQFLGAGLQWVFIDTLHVIRDPDAWQPSAFIWLEGLSAVAAIFTAWIIGLIGPRRFAQLGFASHGALRDLAMGSLYGLAAVVILVGGIAAFGGFTPGHLMMSGTRLTAYAIAWLIAMFGIGISEESQFRGAALLTLGDAIGFWPAAILLSLLFGGLHYFGKGPTENLADGTSVALLGLFTCFTVLRTGAIWFAAGFHALFDYAALYLFGAPNSGNQNGQPIATRLFIGGFHGPAWLTGGPLGVEASWLVFPVIAGLFVVFHFSVGRQAPSPAATSDQVTSPL